MPDISFVDTNIADWLKPRETPPRSSGHHVSDVIVRVLQAASRKFDHYAKDKGQQPDQSTQARWYIGFTWEDVISRVLIEQLAVDPGGRILPARELAFGTGAHQIFGTPDRIIYGDSLLYASTQSKWRIEETKVTWMSNRDVTAAPELILQIPKFQYWTLQLKTYATMLAHPECRALAFHRPPTAVVDMFNLTADMPDEAFTDLEPPTCILRAIFVNSDYKGYKPSPLCWRIDWSLPELAAHWAMIRGFLEDEALAALAATQESHGSESAAPAAVDASPATGADTQPE